jgi:hypothetical protein
VVVVRGGEVGERWWYYLHDLVGSRTVSDNATDPRINHDICTVSKAARKPINAARKYGSILKSEQ